MSAEKEIVNFWLQNQGYFTIANVKRGNKDLGILAVRDSIGKILVVDVCCSISTAFDESFITELITQTSPEDIWKAVNEQFQGREITIERMLVINSISDDFAEVLAKKHDLTIIPFESVVSETLSSVSTGYIKNDVIRSMQLIRHLLIEKPQRMVDVLQSTLGQHKMREFIGALLERDDIVKEFRKTNEERLAAILKSAMLKPERLAELLDHAALTKRSKKIFASYFSEQRTEPEIKEKYDNSLSHYF